MSEVRCRRCSALLGVRTEDEFRVGPLAVRTPFRWRCIACGFVHRWRPGDEPCDRPAAPSHAPLEPGGPPHA